MNADKNRKISSALYVETAAVLPGSYSKPKAASGVDIEAKKKRKAVFPIEVHMKQTNFSPSTTSSSLSSQGFVLVS